MKGGDSLVVQSDYFARLKIYICLIVLFIVSYTLF